MKWVVFDVIMVDGSVYKILVEKSVVVYQDVVGVIGFFYGLLYCMEYIFDCDDFIYCILEWVVGVDIGKIQGGLFYVGIFEGYYMVVNLLFWNQVVVFIYIQDDSSNF